MDTTCAGVRIHTLGGFRVFAGAREVSEARRQPVCAALLVYLAVEREATRDALIGLFWPDRTEAQARHALSQALHKLRRELAEEWVRAEGEALVASERVEIDARDFEREVRSGELEAALALYAGPFLDGWRLHETCELELWVDQQRARLLRLFATACRAHVSAREAAGDLEGALATARRWAQLCPLDEAGQAALIEAQVHAGLRPEAAHQLAAFRRLFESEGLAPSPGIVAHLGRVLSQASPPHDAGGQECVLVLPLENLTSRADLETLGRMAADSITEGLDRTGMVRVVPTLDAVSIAHSVAGAPSPEARMRELARETQARTLVSGSYYLVDGGLEFHAQIVDLRHGELRGTIAPVRVPADQPASGVALLRQRMLGLVAATTDEDWRGLPTAAELGVSPPTYEAYRAFTKGLEHFLREEFGPAIPCLEQAIALDPGFTRATLMAAAAHANLGQWERVGPLLEALEAVAERLSPFEAGALRWHQARLAGDREATYAAASLGWRRYPGTVAHFIAGLSALEASRPRQAVEICRALDPDRGWLLQFHRYWDVLTAAHHVLGEHEVELEAARRGRRHFPLLLAGLAWEVRALAAAGQVASLEERLWEASELPPQHGWSCVGVWLMAAAELRAHGGGPLAAAWAERALERARRHSEAGPLTAPPRSELAFALCAAERWQEAQGLFRRLAAQSPRDLDLKGRLGVLAARRGEVREAASADRALRECRRPYLFGRHTLWRARIAALLGQGPGAVELLQGAFAEGLAYGLELHSDPDLEPLRAHPRFQALVRPRG